MQANGRNPLLGIVVEIEECYIHCAKAFIRSKMWDPESWLNKKELPSAAKMLLEHAKVNTSEEDVARSLEESYTKDCIENFINIALWSGYVRVLEWGFIPH